MKESNLAKAIDKAAEQRADAIVKAIRTAVIDALRNRWRPKEAGEEYIGDDIRRLLKAMSESKDMQSVSFVISSELLAACRAAIINDLLNGLPQLRELAQMASDQDQQ